MVCYLRPVEFAYDTSTERGSENDVSTLRWLDHRVDATDLEFVALPTEIKWSGILSRRSVTDAIIMHENDGMDYTNMGLRIITSINLSEYFVQECSCRHVLYICCRPISMPHLYSPFVLCMYVENAE